jgi:predicted CXXCH cytochrome family protein
LSSFIAIMDRAGKGGNKAVGHVEQMLASRCYLASGGGLGCISCHDPHAVPAPAAKAAYYQQRCLACHDQKRCSLPDRDRLARSPDDSCVLCHMPTSSNSDVVHNATTDHRISRRPLVHRAELLATAAVGPPLVLFHADQLAPAERAAMSRELAVGLTIEARRIREPPRAAGLTQVAIELLDQALARWPDDLVALRHKGQALVLLGRPKEGLHIYDTLLKAAPNYEKALDERVSLALELEDREGALAAAAQAVGVNPWSAEFHERLAYYELQDENWTEARHQAAEALRLNPFLSSARMFWITCLLHANDHERARAEFQRLLALKPTDQESLRLWFTRQVRTRGRG